MGICTSNSRHDYNYYNSIKIEGKIKDVTKDYLLEESIKEPLSNKYKLLKKKNR